MAAQNIWSGGHRVGGRGVSDSGVIFWGILSNICTFVSSASPGEMQLRYTNAFIARKQLSRALDMTIFAWR